MSAQPPADGSTLLPGRVLARVDSRRALSPDVVEVKLALVDPPVLAFRGGQFVTVHLEGPSGTRIARSYSIASRLGERNVLRFVLRQGNEPGSALLAEIPVGTVLTLTGPHGRLALDREHPGDVVFCATGTGASPLMPMLDELAGLPASGRRIVFWGMRTEGDLAAFPELAELCRAAGAELLVHVSAGSSGWAGARGRITDAVLSLLVHLREPTFYLVGGPVMVRHLRAELMERGINRARQIRNEAHLD